MNQLNEQWQQQFQQAAEKLQPTESRNIRSCTDVIGWLVLVFIVLSTVNSRLMARHTTQDDIVQDVEELIVDTLSGQLVWMVVAAALTNILLLLALKNCTEYAVGGSIFIGMAMQVVLLVVLVLHKKWVWTGIMVKWLICSIIAFASHQRQPQQSMMLFRVSSYFLAEVSSVFWVAMATTIFVAILIWGWCIEHWVGMAVGLWEIFPKSEAIIVLLWATTLYYWSVWGVASQAQQWHCWGNESSVIGSWCKLIRHHMGSLGVAALLGIPMKLVELLIVSTKPNECCANPCSRFIVCIFGNCLGTLQYYSLLMGRGAFTLMTLLGDGFVASSRHCGVLVLHNRAAYSQVQVASRILFSSWMSTVACITILVGIYAVPEFMYSPVILIGIATAVLASMPAVVAFNQPMHSLFLLDTVDKLIPAYPPKDPRIATTLYHQSFQRIRQGSQAIHPNQAPLMNSHAREMEAVNYWAQRNQQRQQQYLHPPFPGNYFEVASPYHAPTPYLKPQQPYDGHAGNYPIGRMANH